MPNSKGRRARRQTRARVDPGFRSARARDRQVAALLAPLTPDQMIEAEGYLVEVLEEQIAALAAAADDLRLRLGSLSPTGSDDYTLAGALGAELARTVEARGELAKMLAAVRAHRRFSVPGTLALMAIQSRSRALHGEAERLGIPVDPVALAEAKRREHLIAGWLLEFEPASP